jgi:hypothetical protein
MELPPVEIRQVRPCSICAFYVHLSDSLDGICTLNKGDKKGYNYPRWEEEEESSLIARTCWYNITPEEIEGSVDPWVKSIVNESLRFYNSPHIRREITGGRRRKGRRK